MNSKLLGFLVAAAGVALLILLISTVSPEVETARQYEAIVNNIYKYNNWLTLETPAKGAATGLSQLHIDYSKVHTDDPQDEGLVRLFVRRSYLATDIDRFNHPVTARDRETFDFRHEPGRPDILKGIVQEAHQFRSPLDPPGRWIGKLYFADTAPAASAAGSENALFPVIDLDPVGNIGSLLELTPPDRIDGQPDAEVGVFSSRPAASVRAPIIRFTDPARRTLAWIWRVKNQVVMKMAGPPEGQDQEQIWIRVNGHKLDNHRGELHVLPDDARLAFMDRSVKLKSPAPRIWVLRGQSGPDPLYDARTEIWRYTQDNANPLFARVVNALNTIAAEKGEGLDTDTAVTLTLKQGLDARAGKILRDRLTRYNSGELPGTIAAVTLMDVSPGQHSGELLALPSLPVPPDLSSKPGDKTTAVYREDTQRENHNFTRLPVGSVAKVLLGAAILQSDLEGYRHSDPGQRPYPGTLLTMELAPSTADICGDAKPGKCVFSSVLGIPLGDVHDESNAGWLNLKTALAQSINRYALTLLTLAAVPSPAQVPATASANPGAQHIDPAGDQVRIGGVTLTERPRSLLFNPGSHATMDTTKLRWVGVARALYHINITTTDQTSLNASRDYLWNNLPCALLPAEHSPLLATISPETENFRLETIIERTDFRERYLSLILGDGESRWSSVEVAEAFASLLQNRRVQASLVKNDSPCNKPQAPLWPHLDPEVQKGLTDGMKAVITDPSGTASPLQRARKMLAEAACRLQPQRVFAIYGKTGTPQLPQLNRSPEARVIEQLGKAHVLFPDPKDANPETRQILYHHEYLENGILQSRDERVTLQLMKQLDDDVRAGRGKAYQEFRTYFLNRRAAIEDSKCDRFDARTMWTKLFKHMVAYNLSPGGQSSVRIEGSELLSDEQCYVKSASGGFFGKHFAFVAALYDPAAAGAKACNGDEPDVDVTTHQPVKAIAGVVAVQDATVEQTHPYIAVQTAGDLLCGPVADELGLKVDNAACVGTLATRYENAKKK